MRVLITEDDSSIRTLLCRQISHWGYEALSVENGQEALDMVKSDSPPEIIVMDWMMPVLSGIEACVKIRELEAGRMVYIMMLTSKRDRSDVIKGLDAGADDYLTKPVDSGELQSRLKVAARTIEYEKKLKEYATQMEQLAATRAQQLVNADRLITVGTMVSGIAHEISSPLSAVVGAEGVMSSRWKEFLPLLEPRGKADSEFAEDLEDFSQMLECLRQSTHKISDHVQALRNFYRQRTDEKLELCEINTSIHNALKVCYPNLKHRVETRLELIEPSPYVMMIAQQIEQVLINIINNAAEAIAAQQVKDGYIEIACRCDSEIIQIAISNNGPQIPQEDLDKIWDNFYTTKDTGTGLGLMISSGIIRKHSGQIRVENLQDGGVGFFIELPVVSELSG